MEDMQVNIVQKAEMSTEWFAANYGQVEGVFPTRTQAEKFIASVPCGRCWMSIGADDVTGDFIVLSSRLEDHNEHTDPKH